MHPYYLTAARGSSACESARLGKLEWRTGSQSELARELERWSGSLSEPARELERWSRQVPSGGILHSSVVVPIEHIFRSCLLVADFGRRVDRTWTPETVLDEAWTFYLTPFSDHHMYYFVT